MNPILQTRMQQLVDKLGYGEMPIDVDKYPARLEGEIQSAVAAKRAENYDRSAEIYLNIFNREGRANAEILCFLFKTLVCDEQFEFAYTVISLADNAMKNQIGECYVSPFGHRIEWKQTIYRRQIFNALIAIFRDSDITLMKDLALAVSGNPNYNFKRDKVSIVTEMHNTCLYDIFQNFQN